MKLRAWVLLGVLAPGLVFASEQPVQDSMVVTGTITVNPRGGVAGYTVYDVDKLPPAARQIVQATVPHWQFVPIIADGKAVTAKSGMSLRIVADLASVHARQATLRVAGVEFGCMAGRARKLLPVACPSGASVTYLRRQAPSYPMDALRARVGGEVFVVLQVGRDGRVTQAAVRQVNLYTMSDEQSHYRKVLADASLRAARRWTFRVPTIGPGAAKDHWVVTVPVKYAIAGSAETRRRMRYGRWNAYLPGPVQHIPWDNEDASGSGSGADAIAGGAPFVRDTRFVLETPLPKATG